MATATTNGSKVIKPDHGAERKHMIFTQEHEDLRESMQSWVQKELWPHRNEWEETTWPDSVLTRAGELGFLGIGTPPSIPTWGNIIGTSQRFFTIAPWIIMFPGVALAVAVLAVNLLGDGLRDALDPQTRKE